MILSASRRTDIPCHFSAWFMNRIRAGYALVRNPINAAQLFRVPLSPDVVDCIVFWTKDPTPFLTSLDELEARGYRFYFQFTLTPYGRAIEPGVRRKSELEQTFAVLSKKVGRGRVVWRYDPIILNDEMDIAYHKAQFVRLCERLSPYTDTVTMSFVDLYSKLKTPLIRAITQHEQVELARFIGDTAASFHLRAVACSETADLAPYGIERASCIDRRRIERICGAPLKVTPDKNQRKSCGCLESIDIGAYNTCVNGCIYCYANNGTARAEKRFAAHDPESELLCGVITNCADGNERIITRAVQSDLEIQMSLF